MAFIVFSAMPSREVLGIGVTPYCEYSNCDAIVNEISDHHAFKGFDAKVVSFRLYNKKKIMRSWNNPLCI